MENESSHSSAPESIVAVAAADEGELGAETSDNNADKNLCISLLWPEKRDGEKYNNTYNLPESSRFDLGIEQVVRFICTKDKYIHRTRELFLQFCDDERVIAHRLAVLQDLLAQPRLTAKMEELIPLLHQLQDNHRNLYKLGENQIRKIAWNLEKLELYEACMAQLHELARTFGGSLQSDGLRRLCNYVKELVNSKAFQTMASELPELRTQLAQLSSVTIGINLDNTLQPAEAVFLSVEPKPFKKPSLLSNFLGLKTNNQPYEGISQFHSLKQNPGFEAAFFRDLNHIFEAAVLPVGRIINSYVQFNTELIADLAFDFSFFVDAVAFVTRMEKAGISMCKPQVLPKQAKEMSIGQLTDLILAMNRVEEMEAAEKAGKRSGVDYEHKEIVANDVEFGERGSVFILTGPNQGGKTTYVRSVGLAQALFQAGLYIPGKTAAISPVDVLFTHFNEKEIPDVSHGRLGEEARRLSEIFARATGFSFILLNESFSSTSPDEGLYLANDLVKAIKVLGSRAIFATHFHPLAERVDQLNAELPNDTNLISMVACVEMREDGSGNQPQATRTYKVVAGPPQGSSYARDIASLYGIRFEQMVEKFRERGLV